MFDLFVFFILAQLFIISSTMSKVINVPVFFPNSYILQALQSKKNLIFCNYYLFLYTTKFILKLAISRNTLRKKQTKSVACDVLHSSLLSLMKKEGQHLNKTFELDRLQYRFNKS